MIYQRFCLLICLILTSGCGLSLSQNNKPELFVNEKYSSTNESERGLDVLLCLELADSNVKTSSKYFVIGKSAFYGTLIGTVPGAVSGTILGDTPENTAVGAAVGFVVGVLQGVQKLYDDNPVYQRFVEHCLHKKGYEIIGWTS